MKAERGERLESLYGCLRYLLALLDLDSTLSYSGYARRKGLSGRWALIFIVIIIIIGAILIYLLLAIPSGPTYP